MHYSCPSVSIIVKSFSLKTLPCIEAYINKRVHNNEQIHPSIHFKITKYKIYIRVRHNENINQNIKKTSRTNIPMELFGYHEIQMSSNKNRVSLVNLAKTGSGLESTQSH